MAGDKMFKRGNFPAHLLERVLDQGISHHLELRGPLQVPPDLLELGCGDTIHIDKPDKRVLPDIGLYLFDLVPLPCGKMMGVQRHYNSLSAGPMVVLTKTDRMFIDP